MEPEEVKSKGGVIRRNLDRIQVSAATPQLSNSSGAGVDLAHAHGLGDTCRPRGVRTGKGDDDELEEEGEGQNGGEEEDEDDEEQNRLE